MIEKNTHKGDFDGALHFTVLFPMYKLCTYYSNYNNCVITRY